MEATWSSLFSSKWIDENEDVDDIVNLDEVESVDDENADWPDEAFRFQRK